MNSTTQPSCVTIIAGETSGDLHGAKLVEAMQKRNPGLFFCGMGGPALANTGVRIVLDASELTVVGITEVFSKLPKILKGMAVVKKLLKSLKPDLLILIDFPDFNLLIAATAKKLGIPVLYYISPQIWAWRGGRVKRIAKLVDHMAVILPFEEQFYENHHVPVTFVGHPLLDGHLPFRDDTLDHVSRPHPVIGFMPGSRDKEIARHLPVMLDTANILKEKVKHAKFIISHAPSVARKDIEAVSERYGNGLEIEIVSEGVESVFNRSDVLVAASGTVTLQAAIHGKPMVIIYKVSPMSYWLGRALIRVRHIGLVNLVADRELIPEFIQGDASPDNIATTLDGMLKDRHQLNRLKSQLISLREKLGGPGAAERVAEIAFDLMDRRAI